MKDTLKHSSNTQRNADGTAQLHPLSLRSVGGLYGDKLGASDGEIGRVKDFLFNDQAWVIRYVVADTGSWLPGRLVLIAPHAFGNFFQAGDCLLVNLTRQQIENSPDIEVHKPVSRQREEEYYRYYGWPAYWEGPSMWGMTGFPIAPPPILPIEEAKESGAHRGDDPHLRSTHALHGYHIQAGEENLGHVSDFLMDDNSWAIRHLVVKTGHWFSNKEILISPEDVERISYDESKLFLRLTKDAVKSAPEYRLPDPAYRFRAVESGMNGRQGLFSDR